MPVTQNIETKVDELGNLTRLFMTKVDEQATATKARAAEIEEVLKKANDRIDEIETKANRPLVPAPGSREAVDHAVEIHKKAYDAFLRKGPEGVAALGPEYAKSLATDKDTDGGYFVPANVSSKIIELIVEISPMRSLANIENISMGDSFDYPKEGSTTASVSTMGERSTPTETTTPTFGLGKIPTHYAFAEPRVTQKMLDDAAINTESYLSKKLGEQFGVQESAWFITGTGSGQPEGVVTNADVGIVSGGQSATIDHDDMLSLLAELKEFYAKKASLLARRATKFVLRKLKDGNGAYMWQPSLQVGTPPTYDGVPLFEAPDVAAVGASAKAVLFGDFREGYTIVDRQGIVQLRDPYTAKPFTKFFTTRRVGGQVVKAEAIKILRCGA